MTDRPFFAGEIVKVHGEIGYFAGTSTLTRTPWLKITCSRFGSEYAYASTKEVERFYDDEDCE